MGNNEISIAEWQERWEVLEVESKWEVFHDEFLKNIWKIQNPTTSSIRCLWNDDLKWWSLIEEDLKEYFFMELFICCRAEMKEPEKSAATIREIIPGQLESLEEASQHETRLDIGMYLNCLYEALRYHIWKRGRNISENRELYVPIKHI